MEEFTKMLKQEMELLDDLEDRKGQELRKDLGIGKMSGADLLKYKLDFLVSNMGQKNLNCFERSDYFKELLTNCTNENDRQFFTPTTITCITADSKVKIFWVFTDNKDKSKIIYDISNDGVISKTSQEMVRKQFLSGMRTLSKSREDELKNILLGNELFNTRI